MFKRILLMLKFSENIKDAVAVALQMATCCRARLHILHVLDHRLRDPGVTDDQIAKITWAVEDRFKKEIIPMMGDFKDYYFNCWEGDPANETAKFADKIGADFIILGCHTVGDVPSFNRLGEVGSLILQWAPCPVTLVPCREKNVHAGS